MLVHTDTHTRCDSLDGLEARPTAWDMFLQSFCPGISLRAAGGHVGTYLTLHRAFGNSPKGPRFLKSDVACKSGAALLGVGLQLLRLGLTLGGTVSFPKRKGCPRTYVLCSGPALTTPSPRSWRSPAASAPDPARTRSGGSGVATRAAAPLPPPRVWIWAWFWGPRTSAPPTPGVGVGVLRAGAGMCKLATSKAAPHLAMCWPTGPDHETCVMQPLCGETLTP
jgi:hypothetical protein